MGLEEQIGSLELGKKADLALIDINKLHCSPREGADIYAQLVYQVRCSDVTLTMVDGKILYQDGHLRNMEQENIIKQCSQALVRVRSRAGI
ncbi:hypothetical protein N752_25455 [Desulforamulus aquiferis]|nr:amidohydrolase family protein [Desulforamulus aquiferis]RYD02302.1 hypothetical protein N752_25455 [Desulforamulus aquiferis]